MIDFQVLVNTTHSVAFLETITPRIRAELRKHITRLILEMQREVQRNKLIGGHPLHKRSGDLFRSIHYKISDTPLGIIGRLYSGKEVAHYSFVHEYGGTFSRRGGGTVTYPMRSFMRSTLSEYREDFRAAIKGALETAHSHRAL